jgi:hypothetical protein
MKLEVQIIVINKLGEFRGKKALMTIDQYATLLEMAKGFYKQAGFELTCEDGSFLVFPPDLIQQSILKVIKIINGENVQE